MQDQLSFLGHRVSGLISQDRLVEASEVTEDMLKIIFMHSHEKSNFDRPTDQWSLFCGALSPRAEQVFSNLLMYSGVGHEDEKPIRSDGFVYTEDDRPC